MFSCEITSSPGFDIDKNILDSICENMSKNTLATQKGVINIVFLDIQSIQKLNKQYRWKDSPTDVLSFHYYEDFSALQESDIAWEIVLSEEHVVSQWSEYWLWSEKEFYKLVIHSLLHILGYDHENDSEYEKMQKLENVIWKEVFEK